VNHDEAQEMLALLAAGAVDEAEAAEAVAHARSCETCGPLADAFQEAAAALALALEPAAPPAGLRGRIIEAARAEGGDTASEPVSLARERERLRGWKRVYQWAAPAAAAAALVVVALLAIDNARLRNEDDYSRGLFTSESGAAGSFLVDEENDLVYVRFENMPDVQEGQVFQMWMLDDGAAIPAPTFSASEDGTAAVSFPADVDFEQLAVTVEPRGGSAQPTSTPFIIGS
jgi:anti-sigma-K factor RskA